MLPPGRKVYPGVEVLVFPVFAPCQALGDFYPGDHLHLVINCLVTAFNCRSPLPYPIRQGIFLTSHQPGSVPLPVTPGLPQLEGQLGWKVWTASLTRVAAGAGCWLGSLSWPLVFQWLSLLLLWRPQVSIPSQQRQKLPGLLRPGLGACTTLLACSISQSKSLVQPRFRMEK